MPIRNPKKGETIELYNKSQKEEYIKREGKHAKLLTNYFLRIAKCGEEAFDKDIADMDLDELLTTLTALNIRREETRSHLISLIRGYINWARLTGKTQNDSPINTINAESISSQAAVRSRMIRCPEQIDTIINTVLKKRVAQHNRMSRDKLVVLLLYNGLTIDELAALKKSDIDADEGIIITQNGRYSVDSQIIALWSICANMTHIERNNGKSKRAGDAQSKEVIYSELLNNEYLFRQIMGQKSNKSRDQLSRFFAMIVSKLFADYKEVTGEDLRVSPSGIKDSGMFYRMYQQEINGQTVTPEFIAEHLRINLDTRAEILLATRKWRIDYEDWKLAFGYNI